MTNGAERATLFGVGLALLAWALAPALPRPAAAPPLHPPPPEPLPWPLGPVGELRAERVRVHPAKLCPCAVQPGDAWAVRFHGNLVGYYVACPFCRQVNAVLAAEQRIEGEGESLSFGPGETCQRCSRGFRLEQGAFVEVSR